jgi:GntR family transcriptional regulator/MocR family aminotransferase
MAAALGLSRNTVSLALRVLVDKGFLISNSRSGLIVNGETPLGLADQAMPLAAVQSGLQGDARPVSRMERQRNIMKPAAWQDYAYPASCLP